ncbi:MAG: TIGR04084 family radical SAM/SPASM domain-containing protein [Nanoarchaeota archaeon]|nr:TIGR04084 family radical SAM/SPASM domain-containing protein [Nanoarchaeota archaeon]
MHYHIILTERCNLKCKYCYEKSMNEFENGLEKKWKYDDNIPIDSEVPIKKLKKFLKSEDTLIFYGGEPLMKIDKIKQIIDNINCEFCIQSNGIFLNQLPFEYLQKIKKILLSIDGTQERNDSNRGIGKYEILLKNIKKIKEQGYKGEIIARMVITKPDLFEQVKHLLNLELFDSIHWQIDAEFYKNDYNKKEFTNFVEEYNKSLTKLINFWFEQLKKGTVLKLYPFLGIFNTLYYNQKSKLQCGAGHANFTINTKGDLSACPIMNSVKNFYCGSIEKGITKEISIKNWCKDCDYLDVCGGRCLYSNYAQLWPKEGHDLVCETIKHLIEEIKSKIPEIKQLIQRQIISEKDFEFEKYFGPEIIP